MRIHFWFLNIFLLATCTNKTDAPVIESDSAKIENVNQVKIEILKPSPFKKQLVCNGKLNTLQKSNIAFKVSGRISEIKINNGGYAKKGEIIAVLESTQYKQAFENAEINLNKATLDFENLLIGLGWELSDSIRIPKDILKVTKTRSGYANALLDMEKAKYDLDHTVVRAPFSGLVANVKHKVFEQANENETFCLLLDNSVFEVQFQVLETELAMIELGKKASVVPYVLNKGKYQGIISEINPVIDDYGMVNVKACVKGAEQLIEGMNVNIFVETDIANQLVVPRNAVMLRDNFHVLFKYVKGNAYWTYVNIVYENSEAYSVIANPDKTASLQADDTIIIDGNIYLAHDSKVEIIE